MKDKWPITSRIAKQEFQNIQTQEAKREGLKKQIIELLLEQRKKLHLHPAEEMTPVQMIDALRPIAEPKGQKLIETKNLTFFLRTAWGMPISLKDINEVIANYQPPEQ
ncbi:MAG: hypothetical protein NTX98_01990 [Candidatus Doudnabacteria bacterium]|nr:hypothetical protein [Candidatus Doudnabacteria bacterium]